MNRAEQRWARLARAGVVDGDTANLGRRRSDLWTAAAGVVVLVTCSVIVRDGTVGTAEKSVFDAVNGLPDFLHAPMWIFQLFGLLIAPVLLAILAVVLGRRLLAIGLVATVPLKLLLERGVVKQLVERQRPGTTVPDAIIRDAAVSGLSFPSGHAVFAFVIAGMLAPYMTRRWQIAIFLLAVLNGVARIYLGAHNPLDIVGGAALGLALAGALNYAIRVPVRAD
jgi:undecaprenyl-diphosphatase